MELLGERLQQEPREVRIRASSLSEIIERIEHQVIGVNTSSGDTDDE